MKSFLRNILTLENWDREIIETVTDLRNFEFLKVYQSIQNELSALHEIELFDRINKIKKLHNQINLKLDSQIERSKFKFLQRNILIIVPFLKFQFNTAVLKIFYSVESSSIIKTNKNLVLNKNVKKITGNTNIKNLDKGANN
tara:strand:+ start:5566 stop:5991 length:426 start_codon:yes stop_codon:yes gene_type:complete